VAAVCERVKFEHGVVAIVCGVRGSASRYCQCGRAGKLLCDWKAPHRRSGTCDRPLCTLHATEVAPGKHLCPEHRTAFEAWKRRNGLTDAAALERKLLGAAAPEQATLFAEGA
jgi:hypothetical protein